MKTNILAIIFTVVLVPFLMSQNQIENPGFEDWEVEIVGSGEILEPVNWNTIKTGDNPDLAALMPFNWEQSEDAHSGQYCIKLFNNSAIGLPVVGTLCNGRYHPEIPTHLAYSFTNQDDPKFNTPFTARPDSIAFWVKYFPMEGDTLQFQALLHVEDCTLPPNAGNEGNQVGYTRCDLPGPYENWTRIALAFDYFDDRTPEYLLMILTAGKGTTSIEGSVAYYDDLEIIGGEQAINDNPLHGVDVYHNNGMLVINNMPEDLMKNAHFELVDLAGRIIWQSEINSSIVNLSKVQNLEGLYIVKINTQKYNVSRKIYF
jgi:hypothetical protein